MASAAREAVSRASVSDAEPRTHVLRPFELVEHRDRVVLEGDEAAALRVDEELVVRGAVFPRPLARRDLRRGAQVGPVQPLRSAPPNGQRLTTLLRLGLVDLWEIRLVGERLSGRPLVAARAADVEHALHASGAQPRDQRARVFLERRRGEPARVRARRDGAHHRVGAPRDLGDAVGVRGIALYETNARVGRLDRLRVANDTDDFVTAPQRFGGDTLADVPGGAKQDELHDVILHVRECLTATVNQWGLTPLIIDYGEVWSLRTMASSRPCRDATRHRSWRSAVPHRTCSS